MATPTPEELEQQRVKILAETNAPKPIVIEVFGRGIETRVSSSREVKIINRE